MQGDAKGKNGHSPNPGLNDLRKPSGGNTGRVPVSGATPPVGDRITGLLNTLFTGVAAQPLSAQLQNLTDRLLTPGSAEDPEIASECGDEARTS